MAVTKISNSGIKTGVLKYDSMLAGNAAYDPAATWLIQRIAGTGSSRTITFSNIPQNYQHLQLRIMGKYTYSTLANSTSGSMSFNGDTASNYGFHRLTGNGSSVTASGSINQSDISIDNIAASSNATNANIMGVAIVDIHDYTSTTKNKTVRNFTGFDNNSGTTNSNLFLSSGLWRSTAAITSITITCDTTFAWTTASTFALYGFIGA